MPLIGGLGDSFSLGRRPLGAASPPAPTPSLISVWYDASDSTQFQPSGSNGTNITQWNDKSTAAHNASPVGGSAKPTVVTAVQNGNSILRFNGTNTTLQVPNTTWAQGVTGFTVLICARASTLTGTRTLTSTDQNESKISFNGTNWTVATAGGTGTSLVVGDTTKFHIYSLVFDGTQTGNANRLRFRYDKAPQTLSYTGTVGSALDAEATKFNLCWSSTTSSEFFGGDLAEVLIYTRVLSNSELTNEENYLSYHWGL